jgi:hypothetical protein
MPKGKTKVTQHLHIITPLKELELKLDLLALDGWTLLTSSPMNANAAELGEEALILCILSREVTV